MVRLTFKQFISENRDFITSTMELMPDKYITDPSDPSKKILNPKYLQAKNYPASFPSDQDQLKVEIDKPEQTEFDPREAPKTVVSGGRAKEMAIKRAGQAYTNDYFYGGSDFFRPGPGMYTPSSMPLETPGRR
ncbi:MAG: hypothetical protein RL253_296 [Bacteroidota bacterium]|jgi:hypothetical protein